MGRCRWNIWDAKDAIRYDLPGCYGGAEYGPSGCTCDAKRDRASLEERVEHLEEIVRALTSDRDASLAEDAKRLSGGAVAARADRHRTETIEGDA